MQINNLDKIDNTFFCNWSDSRFLDVTLCVMRQFTVTIPR